MHNVSLFRWFPQLSKLFSSYESVTLHLAIIPCRISFVSDIKLWIILPVNLDCFNCAVNVQPHWPWCWLFFANHVSWCNFFSYWWTYHVLYTWGRKSTAVHIQREGGELINPINCYFNQGNVLLALQYFIMFQTGQRLIKLIA